MNVETFLANFGHLAEAPNGIPKLRELILQLAVRGKLVPQDPNDEPASELLKKIQAEKQRLIKAGVVRKSREPGDVAAEDELYHIPPSWEWVRLAHVGSIVGGGTPRASDSANFASNGIPWVTPADMRGLKGKYVSRGSRDLSKAGLQNSSATLMPPGTVLFSSRAPIGYVAIAENEISTNQGFKSVVPYVAEMSEYIHCFLASAADEIDRNASGTTFREISGKGMSIVRVSLPPLAEQKRIVAKVDELMTLCDDLEAKQQAKRTKQIALNRASLHALTQSNGMCLVSAWHRVRDHFDDLYTVPETVSELRQTILQLAVMGRLVPQDPNDEPASELLKKIQIEKQRLIAEGVIRKPKPLSPIDLDEIPYELPAVWKWAFMEALAVKIHYGYTAAADHSRDDVRLLRITDIQNNQVDWSRVPGCRIEGEKIPGYQLARGDIMIARTGGTIGKSYLVKDPPDLAVFASYLIRIVPAALLVSAYVKLFLDTDTYWEQLYAKSMGTGQPNVNATSLKSLVVPLPPQAEQKRIVTRVDNLMALCDDLEAKLQQTQTDADNLLAAIVHELVGGMAGGPR